MTMTRKHFEELANSMAENRPPAPNDKDKTTGSPFVSVRWNTWSDCVRTLADFCRRQNPRFDTERFITACHER